MFRKFESAKVVPIATTAPDSFEPHFVCSAHEPEGPCGQQDWPQRLDLVGGHRGFAKVESHRSVLTLVRALYSK